MKRFNALLLLLVLLVPLAAACAFGYHPKPKISSGGAEVRFYAEPVKDSSGEKGKINFVYTLTKKEASKLLKTLKSQKNWKDDSAVDRLAFEFVGEIVIENNEDKVFFTSGGIVYFDHYFTSAKLDFVLKMKDRAERVLSIRTDDPGRHVLSCADYAKPGERVVLKTELIVCAYLVISYRDPSGNVVTVDRTGNNENEISEFSFVMPDYDVDLSVHLEGGE